MNDVRIGFSLTPKELDYVLMALQRFLPEVERQVDHNLLVKVLDDLALARKQIQAGQHSVSSLMNRDRTSADGPTFYLSYGEVPEQGIWFRLTERHLLALTMVIQHRQITRSLVEDLEELGRMVGSLLVQVVEGDDSMPGQSSDLPF